MAKGSWVAPVYEMLFEKAVSLLVTEGQMSCRSEWQHPALGTFGCAPSALLYCMESEGIDGTNTQVS